MKRDVGLLVAELRALGFTVARRSANGSRYLRYERLPYSLRVSDHWQAEGLYDQFPNTIYSYKVHSRMTPEKARDLALTIGIRFILRARDRKGLVREHAA